LESGEVKCWGWNQNGQLGDGTTINRHVPVSVQGIVDAASLSAGWGQTCAILEGGELTCWGWNASGQLGDGTTIDRLMPVSVQGLAGARWVDSGGRFTCALLEQWFGQFLRQNQSSRSPSMKNL